MRYNVLSVDQKNFLDNREDLIDAANGDLLLEPVRCIDCDAWVPYGWIEFGKVKCPQGTRASGVQYGHRVSTEVANSIKDVVLNNLKGSWI